MTTTVTEAEIREAADAAVADKLADFGELVFPLSAPIRYLLPEEDPDRSLRRVGLWDDLRPSQAARLAELGEAIYTKSDLMQQDIIARIREFVVEAALTFAAEYPDAPRAVREPVPA